VYRISNRRVLCVAVGSASRHVCVPCVLVGIGLVVGVAMLLHGAARPLVIIIGALAVAALAAIAVRDCRTLYVDAYGLLIIERRLWHRNRQTHWWREEVAGVSVGTPHDGPTGRASSDLILRHASGEECVIVDSDAREPLQELCDEIRSRLALPATA
jgi:hypothetical protein